MELWNVVPYLHVRHKVSEQAKLCREKAADCERRMLLATDPAVQKTYRELANQWREMADQAEELEKKRESQG